MLIYGLFDSLWSVTFSVVTKIYYMPLLPAGAYIYLVILTRDKTRKVITVISGNNRTDKSEQMKKRVGLGYSFMLKPVCS